jgi:hypothetical protein
MHAERFVFGATQRDTAEKKENDELAPRTLESLFSVVIDKGD